MSNIYKDLSDQIVSMTQSIKDKVYAEELDNNLLELARDEGFQNYKEYEEANL